MRGCGARVAHGLARAGLGDDLLVAARSLQPRALTHFLVQWRTRLRQELLTNSSGFLSRKQPALARKVPVTFPNQTILKRYATPHTSWTENTVLGTSRWTPGELNFAVLASLCERFFSWGIAPQIMKCFRDHIYAGACVQRLSSVHQPPFFS